MVPIFGAMSDRFGRRKILFAAIVPYTLLLYPLFAWIVANPTFSNLILMQIVLCSLIGVFFGPFATVVAEQFPLEIRTTGMSAAYNIAVMLFGGFAQFIVTWLIHVTELPTAPVFYVLFAAVLGLIGTTMLQEPADLKRSSGGTLSDPDAVEDLRSSHGRRSERPA
jgi:MHS family proline/betaine transporter-like MFS transporter